MGREIKNIVIYGPGLMGNGLAQVFASNPDLKVTMVVRPEDNANVHADVLSNLEAFIQKGIYTEAYAKDLVNRILVTEDRIGPAREADFIIECVPENLQIKQALFADLEQHCKPETILATNTSVISIGEIAQKTIKKDRVVGAHFWNPPYLIPLVEVVKAEETSEEVMEQTMALLRQVGKKPIYVQKDVPGFVANRLQHALWREAISIVERGIADAKTVDEALRYGPGIRLPQLAPIENADMVGIDLTYAIHSYLLKHLEDSHEPSPLLKEMLERGDLGFKSGKGFRTWTPEEAQASKKALSAYLIDALYE